jgi:methyl-accepting chemotaxis protein
MAITQIAAAMASMRRESEQASRALKEQSRAVHDMTTATVNTAKHMKSITHANREHSEAAARLLSQLRDIRVITDRNARDVRETRGGTADLLRQATELAGLVDSGRSGSRPGRTATRAGGNGKSHGPNGRG